MSLYVYLLRSFRRFLLRGVSPHTFIFDLVQRGAEDSLVRDQSGVLESSPSDITLPSKQKNQLPVTSLQIV